MLFVNLCAASLFFSQRCEAEVVLGICFNDSLTKRRTSEAYRRRYLKIKEGWGRCFVLFRTAVKRAGKKKS